VNFVSHKPPNRPKIAKELPPHRPKKEFQNIFSKASKTNKKRNAKTNTTKKNDTETQQRQWFTDIVDKNASWQQLSIVFYCFFTGQVEIPKIAYNGQKLIILVKVNTPDNTSKTIPTVPLTTFVK
jgi:transposase